MLSSPRTQVVLWLVFAFVTWNVVFDREVAVAGIEFTREQILRAGQGQPLRSIDEAFSPRVGTAALVAWAWTSPVIAAGALVVVLTRRRARSA